MSPYNGSNAFEKFRYWTEQARKEIRKILRGLDAGVLHEGNYRKNKRGERCSKEKTPLLQLAQTTEGAVAKLLTGSRKHALELANPLRSFMPIPTEGRFQRLLHQFVLYDSTTVANMHPLLLQQLTEGSA